MMRGGEKTAAYKTSVGRWEEAVYPRSELKGPVSPQARSEAIEETEREFRKETIQRQGSCS